MSEKDFELLHGFLVANFDSFYAYLEDVHEIEGTEAEGIMATFEEMYQQQKEQK